MENEKDVNKYPLGRSNSALQSSNLVDKRTRGGKFSIRSASDNHDTAGYVRQQEQSAPAPPSPPNSSNILLAREERIRTKNDFLRQIGLPTDDLIEFLKTNKEQRKQVLTEEEKLEKETRNRQRIEEITHGLKGLPTRAMTNPPTSHTHNESPETKRLVTSKERNANYWCRYCGERIRVKSNVSQKTAYFNHIKRNKCTQMKYIHDVNGKLTITTKTSYYEQTKPNKTWNIAVCDSSKQQDSEDYFHDEILQGNDDVTESPPSKKSRFDSRRLRECYEISTEVKLLASRDHDVVIPAGDEHEDFVINDPLEEVEDNQQYGDVVESILIGEEVVPVDIIADTGCVVDNKASLPRSRDGSIIYSLVIEKENSWAKESCKEPPLLNMLEYQRCMLQVYSEPIDVRMSNPLDIIALHETANALAISSNDGDILIQLIKEILENNGISNNEIHLPKHMRSVHEACLKNFYKLDLSICRRLYPLPEKYFGHDQNPREGVSFNFLQILAGALLNAKPENVMLEVLSQFQKIRGNMSRIFKTFMTCKLAERCCRWVKETHGKNAFALFISISFDSAAANTSQTRSQCPLSFQILKT